MIRDTVLETVVRCFQRATELRRHNAGLFHVVRIGEMYRFDEDPVELHLERDFAL